MNKKNESGFALVIVLIAMVTLTFLAMDLSTLTEWNSYRGYQLIDKEQAKLNAESGLRLSMAKLRVYQEAWNLLEKNQDMKKIVSPSLAERIATSPFVFPIPIPKGTSIIQKQAAEKFEKDSLLPQNGSILVSMQSYSGFINPNLLRLPDTKSDEEEEPSRENEEEEDESKNTDIHKEVEKQLISILNDLIEKKKENDEYFANKFTNIDTLLLVKELKFYVNDQGNFKDVELGQIEPLYSANDIRPKHAPLSSIEEMYQLQGWDDEIVDLIKDRLSVAEVMFIQVNNITEGDLKIIFPDITEIQTQEFFEYRDGSQEKKMEPNPFNSTEEFKSAVTSKLGIVDSSTYDSRIEELSKAGLKIGTAGKLFKITSTGKFNETEVTITALVDLPVEPKAPTTTKKAQDQGITKSTVEEKDESSSTDQSSQVTTGQEEEKKDEVEKNLLMEPRVIDIRFS